jgi:5,10-methylenetetrahydromethanopterin reductase
VSTGDGEAVELWTPGVALPRLTARLARDAEAAGWDGMVLPDSQNLAGDVFVGLAMAAAATERLQLATGVTNPLTRHPAVTAGAIASIQAESGGRAVLGVGRGDSSLAHLGWAPAPVDVLESFVRRVQAYLRRDDVPFDESAARRGDVAGGGGGGGGRLRPIDELGLAAAPSASRLHWLRAEQAKVPVDVVASGPRVIAMAAVFADRVTFAVGADPERLRWAADTARAARRDAGLDADAISFGAYVNVVPHRDRARARELAAGSLASFARFSVMHGTPTGPVAGGDRDVFENIARSYDMGGHFRHGSPQSGALTDDFVDRFGIVGEPDECAGRLIELIRSTGLDRVVVVGPSAGADREEAAYAAACVREEILPAVRGA